MDNSKAKRTWAEINLGNLEHNYREIRRVLPAGTRFAGICKANAYGHGAVAVAKRLEEIGADCIAVSCYEEATELRQAGIKLPLLVLAPSPAFLAPELAGLGCTQTVGSIDDAREMSRLLSSAGLSLNIHIKLETGMGRTGFNIGNSGCEKQVDELLTLPGLNVTGVFTHFAVSGNPESGYTEAQFERFVSFVDAAEKRAGRSLGIRHCANSGAVVNYRHTAMDMVRPGLLLYGLAPDGECGGLDLRPVMSLKTRVCAITEHSAGDTISYGRIFTCARDTRLAVIPVGYADGLHRSLSGNMDVLIGGRRAAQVGRICMDMCMVDITDIPGVKTGDIVTVFGEDQKADELARRAGTVSWELLCAVSPRVPRIYIG